MVWTKPIKIGNANFKVVGILAEQGSFILGPFNPDNQVFIPIGTIMVIEQERGFDGLDDNLWAGELQAELAPGEELTVVATLDAGTSLNGRTAYTERRDYEQRLVDVAQRVNGCKDALVDRLALASDQFIVQRPRSTDPNGRSILAGFPWFTDWGRDTFISLPGLCLVTGQHETAWRIIESFTSHVSEGMVPNRFPDAGEQPEYNTIDASLWFIHAIGRYLAYSNDEARVHATAWPAVKEIITAIGMVLATTSTWIKTDSLPVESPARNSHGWEGDGQKPGR